MEELLGFLLEIVGEFLLELLVALISRALVAVFGPFSDEEPDRVLTIVGYMILGLFAGAVSLILFPHPLVHPSRLHGISLIVTPTLTGALMSLVGFSLRRYGKRPVRIESFTYGFGFAIGLTVVRFLFVR